MIRVPVLFFCLLAFTENLFSQQFAEEIYRSSFESTKNRASASLTRDVAVKIRSADYDFVMIGYPILVHDGRVIVKRQDDGSLVVKQLSSIYRLDAIALSRSRELMLPTFDQFIEGLKDDVDKAHVLAITDKCNQLEKKVAELEKQLAAARDVAKQK
jgi:hypothetical protein